jgi:chromosome segregation ATPase
LPHLVISNSEFNIHPASRSWIVLTAPAINAYFQTGRNPRSATVTPKKAFMNLGQDQLQRIQEKLQQLLKKQDILEKENNWLRKELSETKSQASQNLESIDRLKQQIEAMQLSSGDINDADKKQLEKRLTAYIKEIDRCIAMLGS